MSFFKKKEKKNRTKRSKNIRSIAVWSTVSVLFFALIIFYFTRETRAVAGDFALYREASGGESITTTLTDQAWDTTVSQAGLFSIDGTKTTVTLSEAGHYLLLYNIGTRAVTGTQKGATQGYLDVNGSQSSYGRASCYLENQEGQDTCWLSGAAIVNTAVVNETVKVQTQRIDDGTLNIQRIPNASGFSVIKLDNDWTYARIREVGGGQTFNSSAWATVSLDTNDELDAGYTHTAGSITLPEAGNYLVTSNVEFLSTAGGKNRLLATRLTLDGYELDGTRVTALITGSNDVDNGVASFVGIIRSTSTSQVLRLEGACIGEECGKVSNVADETAVSIVKLPDTVEIVGITETVGGQQVDATNDPITWDTNQMIDAYTFAHSATTNTSRVSVLADDDYLFFSTFFNTHTVPTTVILDPHWQWRVNGGTVLPYGSFSSVNRGDDGSRGAYSSGASGGAIVTSLSQNDFIEVINTDESASASTNPTFQGGLMGLQGIRLSTLQEPDITVTHFGSQFATSSIPVTDFYIGGGFSFVANHTFPTETVTSITLTETGSVDAQNDLSNVRLYYEFDTSDPYDCESESYAGTETQYGATSSAFSAANGTATFSDTVVASSTQTICAYVVLDVDSTAVVNETIDIEISSPDTDVVLGGGPVGPRGSVPITGTTVLEDDLLTLVHYHWRNDAGDSATGGIEDTPLDDLAKTTGKRLRIEVSNEGSANSPATQYRLEYATRTASCADVSTQWIDVADSGGAWDMFDSINLINGDDTTNIATTTGGVTDENDTFLSPNGAVLDTTSQSPATVLTSTEFLELEYGIQATGNALDGTSYCFRLTDAGTPLAKYDTFPEAAIAADVLVSANGSHVPTVDASTADFYIGGSWAVVDKGGSRDVTQVTLTETGSVDAQNDLSNVRLYYEFDTSDPYDCESESYAGTETQYGATSSAFSAANGIATFSDTVTISTTQALCMYGVVDVGPDTQNDQTLKLEISDPGSQVTVSSGTVNPNTPVGPSASTTIQKAHLEQTHYHWRNDDGSESGASSATGGVEDTPETNVKKTETQRLRIQVSNTGGTSTVPNTYTLQYASKTGTCAATGGWKSVGAIDSVWVMSDTNNLINGDDTTNIATTTGGVTDENDTFLTPNGAVLDTQATSSSIAIGETEFLELEYAIEATTEASFGQTYCFRLAGSDATIAEYVRYPETTIRQNQDYYIQRGYSTIPNSASTISIDAGTEYIAPSASSSAFIRITNTMHTGAGAISGGGAQNSDRVTVHISNPENITSSVTFTRTGTIGTTKVYWEIIEYTGPKGGDNEMIVRDARAHTSGNKSLVENIGVSGVVDGADVVVFLTGQSTIRASTDEYQTGLVTTDWNSTTNEAVIERDAYGAGAGNPVTASIAVVEFTGDNWIIQRTEHTYSAAGSTQNQTINSVNDLSRAFIHSQHRTSSNTVADYGHIVWLSAVNTVSFQISSNVAAPANHTSVAWVIENTQTNGTPLEVTRSNGAQSAGGVEPATYSIPIGKTLNDINTSSIFATMYSNGADLVHPRAVMGARIASTTHYELWISDTGSSRSYRTEIVEWPTAVLTISQNYFRFYVDNDALDPTDPWPVGATDLGENAGITGIDFPPANGDRIRIRMSLNVAGSNISQSSKTFKLQYGVRETSCSAVSSWYDTGSEASSTAVWRGYNATPLDGTALSTDPPTADDLNLSVSDRAGTYEESNPTAQNPYKIFIGDDVEFDWILEAHDVADLTSYCFRMTESDGSILDEYTYYPTVTIAGFVVEQKDWRWYDDEGAITPTVPLAASNTAPSNISFGEAIKLRVLVEEIAGKTGAHAKYKLQWSEYSDFSVVNDVSDRDICEPGSRWCYFDGAGTEGATITAKVLEGADVCTGGSGDGCGTHNEYSYTPQVIGEFGTTTTDNNGTTVALQHSYNDPVFIVESIGGDATGSATNNPAVAILTATTSSSFTVRVQEPDNETDTHGNELISYIVMERGAYELPDGRRVDVGSIDTSQYYGNAVAGASDDTCSFTQTFTDTPVVLAALQTNNNTGSPDFLTASVALITNTDFACSLEVPDGETNVPGTEETIGWIAIEGGTFTNNDIAIEATSTDQVVTGWTDTPWYEQSFTQSFSSIPGIVATKQTRNGAEGGWVRFDNTDLNSVQLAFDERDDGERTHTGERVGYLAFGESGVIYDKGVSDFTFTKNTVKEFEFTITHLDARPNVTYFFRLFDVGRDEAVAIASTSTSPSLSTEGAVLSFSISGIEAGTYIESVTMDATTTATTVPFGTLPLSSEMNAGQRFTVSTNATEGYQILAFERQNLMSSGGATVGDVTGTNAAPTSWSVGCAVTATSCYGYHVGDNTLENGSTRFLLDDTFAALTSTPEEVAYSSGPVTGEVNDILYRIKVNAMQPAGRYESRIGFIVVPVF